MTSRKKDRRISLRGLSVNLLLCIGTIAAFFAGSEFLARFFYTPQKFELAGTFTFDKEKVFGLKKNYEGTYEEAEFKTNSFGYRGREISVAKPENTVRILTVGDSITFGHGVSDNETYPALLEQELQSHFSEQDPSVNVEVINTGVPGNSPFQEYYDLKRGLKFSPDAIVLQLTLNDIVEPHAKWILQDMGIPDGELEVVSHDYILGITSMSQMNYLLKQHSAFYLFLRDMSNRIRFRDPTGKNVAEKAWRKDNYTAALMVTDPENPRVQQAWENAMRWIQGMVDEAAKRNIPLILVSTPYNFQFSLEKHFAHPQQTLRKFAEENGLSLVDLLTITWKQLEEKEGGTKSSDQIILEEKGKGTTSTLLTDVWNTYFLDYCHPSIEGNSLLSEHLLPVVLNVLTGQTAPPEE